MFGKLFSRCPITRADLAAFLPRFPPKLIVSFHHDLEYGEHPDFHSIIKNVGGPAVLFTNGTFGGHSMGEGHYLIMQNETIPPGYYDEYGPIITDEFIENGCVHVHVRFVARNWVGRDEYVRDLYLPVSGIPE